MRTHLALALVLAACGRSDRTRPPAAGQTPSASATLRGPDVLVLRLPRAGGAARAYLYPRLDSAVWTSGDRLPPVERLLAFDENAGSVAAVDAKGAPLRLDLRLGAVSRESGAKLARPVSSDGAAIYGIGAKGEVRRITPSDTAWRFHSTARVRDVVPLRDGTLLVLGDRGGRTTIWHLHPPNTNVIDTAVVAHATRVIGSQSGDRLYLAVDDGMIGVRAKDLSTVSTVKLDSTVASLVTTPSGDRIYAAPAGRREVVVVDRYSSRIEARVALPGGVAELRMDPTGRYVLVRPERGDSAWVIAVATNELIGTTRTAWRSDLPLVTPDGSIALLHMKDVLFIDGQTLRPGTLVPGGGADLWMVVAWNGFRPRRPGLDEPVTFARADSGPPDTSSNPFSGQIPGRDTQTVVPDSAAGTAMRAPPNDSAARRGQLFTVQFAALRSEEAARESARGISVNGVPPRIVSTSRDGATIYRVVSGPFSSRADAERAASSTGRSYWIYEGAP
ncbi:MAG: SPOR domain-containing protein [Gemmatimonadota bacterium]|nr:SPOR domain-containing protein [Gemmatimonadota bacterium]